ncbi:hypothetical protein Z517_09549 [Fonsecaea pedrosoi CBS 271.37]|uniref:Zn(2)-C6 fungal-type domain-containing protein n=1 Tax=Fonsecaea pedrosoi CBS 271.37 TaxID=1442368 RepID=A0A0D2G8T8_9EURO|nr:uncharacterized protein Z517_09549 [Fonsecaea pedrosoi CBS 271.37]KIW77103.1 hypothetical protein Z517_09549 [Fonsecaea pedrosoi CBS 271.37]
MQEDSGAIPPRRRVRSGCLTCRGRRRKCDEGKPVCRNCRTKNLTCRYGLNITFVDSRRGASTQAKPSSTDNIIAQNESTPRRQTSGADGVSRPRGTRPLLRTTSALQHQQNASEPSSDSQRIQNQNGSLSEPLSDSGVIQYQNTIEPTSRHSAIQPEFPLPASPQTSRTPFPEDFDSFGSIETPFPQPSSLSVPDDSRDSNLERLFPRSDIANSEAILDEEDEQGVIELFTFFRYQIAPRLDLGVGEAFFGIDALLKAKTCGALCKSILALSSCQRHLSQGVHPEADDARSAEYALKATLSVANAGDEDRATALILLTLRDMILNPPGSWSNLALALQQDLNVPSDSLQEGQWQVMARLVIAARLTASISTTRVDLSFVVEGARTVLPGQTLTNKQQLHQAFSNLARALMIPDNNFDTGQRTRLPVAAVWQSCWSDCELWYFARNEEMQQVFEVDNSDSVTAGSPTSPPFPIIIFSNSCALMANFAHHLTAIHLLHHKPRLIRPIAGSGWSVSPAWHAQRLVGTIAAFNEAEIFDPLVVAGLIYGARKLSHPSQLAVVANILRKAAQTTGMQLQQEIEKTQYAHGKTTG